MRISDWSSDVCSSDLLAGAGTHALVRAVVGFVHPPPQRRDALTQVVEFMRPGCMASAALLADLVAQLAQRMHHPALQPALRQPCQYERDADGNTAGQPGAPLRARQHRSEEHTSELQSLKRHPYARLWL